MCKRDISIWLIALLLCLVPVSAIAQAPPPKIGPWVFDVHGTVPRFPSDDQQLADSRGMIPAELPGFGLGLHSAFNLYFLRWKAVTFGIGADLALARAHSGAETISTGQTARAATERFTHVAPDISFNFGKGNGWSYISGGISKSKWSLVPDGEPPVAIDDEALKTINYGGGARWFKSRHLAFSFDVRFYAIDPSAPQADRPSSPRTTLFIAGAGISLK